MNATERRREPRARVHDLVHVEEYSYTGRGQFKSDDALGRTIDLSHSGCRLELDHPLHFNTRLVLDVALGDRVLRVGGRVRSIDERAENCHHMGIEFEGVDLVQHEQLAKHLRGRD
jgi:hypothetical protein